MELDFNELRELLATIDQTDISEFTLKSGEFELKVCKGMSVSQTGTLPSPIPSASAGGMVAEFTQGAAPPVVAPSAGAASSAVVGGGPSAGSAPPAMDPKTETIDSPMVGTFYRSISPGEAPFVEVGDRVGPTQTVCIIEAFKVMNEVEAEVSGEVIEILVENGESVEFDQPLMRVKPA